MSTTERFDIRSCPDGRDHVYGDEQNWVAVAGPMEGNWVLATCTRCGVGSLRTREGYSGLNSFLASLEVAGCDPQEVADGA